MPAVQEQAQALVQVSSSGVERHQRSDPRILDVDRPFRSLIRPENARSL